MPNQSLHDIDDHLRHIEAINSEVRSVMRASSSAASSSSNSQTGEAELGGSPEPIPSTPDPQLPSSYEFFPLVSLPDVVVRRLLYFLSYDQVAKMRSVCKRMDSMCGSHLNLGFRNAEKYHTQLMKKFKSRLPRRESERRNHPLIRHCDVLTAIETRISLLQMTFMKYVDAEACCFIPGKVIDELFEVLRKISATDAEIPRSYEVLQELRDISSMAMEFFDEKIVPSLKVCEASFRSPAAYLHGFLSSPPRSLFSTPSSSHAQSLRSGDLTPVGLNEEWKLTGRRMKVMETKHKVLKGVVRRQVSGFKKTISDQTSALANLESLVSVQQSLIASQNEKLKAQDKKIDDLVAKWNDDSDNTSSRKRKAAMQDGLDGDDEEEAESRPRSSKRTKKITT